MDIWIVTKDLGDGDVGLYYFSTRELGEAYMAKHEDACWHESNPHHIRVDANFKFDDQ